ncbi:MAG: MBL fold metallo-hydrolase [Candidatus Lokiarchaeota archaeon]|nr:MBL fold metallo-hydrolase [Candidatus Lokiarchaeota archaeon]
MRVPGLQGVYFYRHQLGTNCVVYALERGDGALDLIDTGIYYIRPVLASVVRGMARDGLDFHRVKNIFHTHGHFDHCQADKWFIERSAFDDVKVFCPAGDAWRLQRGNDERQLGYFLGHMKRYVRLGTDEMLSRGGFGSIAWQFRFFVSRLMKIPPLDAGRVIPLHDGATVRIGAHEGRVITTGGHSDGHSFFHFPGIDALVIGDHDAVNELTCDYRRIIKAAAIIRDLDPKVCLVGHQGIPATREACRAKAEHWFTKLHHVVGMLARATDKFGGELSMGYFMDKLLGYLRRISWLRYWTFQNLFVLVKLLVDEGIGTIALVEERGDLVLSVSFNAVNDFLDHLDERVAAMKRL